MSTAKYPPFHKDPRYPPFSEARDLISKLEYVPGGDATKACNFKFPTKSGHQQLAFSTYNGAEKEPMTPELFVISRFGPSEPFAIEGDLWRRSIIWRSNNMGLWEFLKELDKKNAELNASLDHGVDKKTKEPKVVPYESILCDSNEDGAAFFDFKGKINLPLTTDFGLLNVGRKHKRPTAEYVKNKIKDRQEADEETKKKSKSGTAGRPTVEIIVCDNDGNMFDWNEDVHYVSGRDIVAYDMSVTTNGVTFAQGRAYGNLNIAIVILQDRERNKNERTFRGMAMIENPHTKQETESVPVDAESGEDLSKKRKREEEQVADEAKANKTSA